ncbi:MAG: RDD family protein [Humibacillus sp.]|nr:RDD family protein [Humibacillus sp.]MDN5775337.1 RDD family protein [Humibacillus sp.]
MVDREDIGSWLDGPRSRTTTGEWRGQRLGMPRSGPGSLGSFGRRLVGVLIDWAIATLIAAGLFRAPLPFTAQAANGNESFTVLGVFGVMTLLLTATLGFTIGHRVVGLQVRALSQTGRVLPLQAFARTVLLCLFIPAVIWDKDGRGLHDKAANTVIVRAR